MLLDTTNAHSEDDFQRRQKLDAGFYHCAVNNCEEKASQMKGTPGVAIEFMVICDGVQPDRKTPTNGQANKTISAFYTAIGESDDTTKKCLNNLTRLALATGVMQPGQKAEPDWSQAIGREVVIQVVDEQKEETDDNGKKKWVKTGYTKVDWFGFWSLGNPAIKDIPKDPMSPGMQALARGAGLSGGNGQQAGGNSHSGDNGAAQQTQPPAEAAAGTATAGTATSGAKKKWANL